MTVTETEPLVTCDDKCLTVHDTGVKLVRTVTFTEHHAVSEVRDQWITTDGRPHRIRLTHCTARHRSGGSRERGVHGVQARPERAGERTWHDPDPGRLGSLTFDPAPAAFGFADTNLLEDVLASRRRAPCSGRSRPAT